MPSASDHDVIMESIEYDEGQGASSTVEEEKASSIDEEQESPCIEPISPSGASNQSRLYFLELQVVDMENHILELRRENAQLREALSCHGQASSSRPNVHSSTTSSGVTGSAIEFADVTVNTTKL